MRPIHLWPRWLKILGGILLAMLLFLAVALWPVRPDVDHLRAVADEYEVKILRDSWEVPHVFGQTDPDTAFGLAYAHAEDDFLTIQQTLAAARGTLAAIYGPDAAPADYFVHLLRLNDLLDEKYEQDLSPETRALLDGYADGLNLYAAHNPDEVLPGLFPVEGRDVAAGFVHKTPLFFGLDDVIAELFEEERQRPLSTGPDTAGPPRLPLPEWTYFGSNVLSVAPSRTANGETFLAVNSHQPWSGPVTWYEAHLHSESGWEAAGGLFPGTPIILVGHNRDLGWAMTVSQPDLVDVFVLDINPDNPNQYRFDGEWRDLEVREAPIKVKLFGRLSWTVREEVLWSVYGPTVRRPHGTYAIRYAGFGEVGLVEQWYRMNLADDFNSWQAAMREGPLPTFNVGYADKEGNIYYLYNALLPLRAPGYNWEQYLPGDTSATLWTDYLPFDELPQVLNPASGFIQNSNSSPFETTIGAENPPPDAYPVTLGIESWMTNRALRSLELFGSDSEISEAEFTAYKFDITYAQDSDVGRLVDILRNQPASSDPVVQEALTLFADWDLVSRAESSAPTIPLLTLYFLNEREGVDLHASRLVAGEFEAADVVASFEQALDHLNTHFGHLDVPWGEVNRLRRGAYDGALGGGPDLLHAIYGDFDEDGRLRAGNGDSYVMLVTWEADGSVRSRSIHQFGSATLDPDSPHFADQAPLFSERLLKPVWLDEGEIRANLSRAYTLGEDGIILLEE